MPDSLRATYRVQLNAGFGFDAAASLAAYLSRLGVSHLYASPYLQAAPGSGHGYDVVDFHRVNQELGGPEAHARLCRALGGAGLGQVLDLVPNHMSTDARVNLWWRDVLENGPASRYASYFDVFWDSHPGRAGGVLAGEAGRLLLPVLGDHLARVLERGELKLQRGGASFAAVYYDHAWPVSLPSLSGVLGQAARRVSSDTLASIVDALDHLPPSCGADPESADQRYSGQEARLDRLCRKEPLVSSAIDAAVDEVNGSPQALGDLLDRQCYRLAYWRVAKDSVGYRRFFDINSLVGLRVEDPQVFEDSHRLVGEWAAGSGPVLDGLRIDHPDGLRDPDDYLQRLRGLAPDAWIVAEKILAPGERLPESWPVAGTTGYDFANRVGGLLVDPAGEQPLTELYQEFTGQAASYPQAFREKKLLVLREVLGADVNRLSDLLQSICRQHRLDYTPSHLKEALAEMAACFPVYRSYVRPESGTVRDEDARYITAAAEAARANWPELDGSLFDFIRDLLLLRAPARGAPSEGAAADFVLRFQQLTAPATAKGVEDTLFYTFNRLVSLNEVGGNPGRFGVSPEEFHRACAEAQERWPLGMLATSTHDTKRSEDMRVRIHLLSEIPRQWREAVQRWATINEEKRRGGMPDRNAEYLFYQSLVGAWPIFTERAAAYMEKASREAKEHTSWTSPNPDYDAALRAFVEESLADRRFTEEVESFAAPLVDKGRVASLSQTLLKLTAPGIPDIYRGTELWDLSLVDPDNRRPVDFDLRQRLLSELENATPEGVLARMDEGLPKLWTIQRALDLRRRRPELFGPEGEYRPLTAQGVKARHLVAFQRGQGAITAVPRLVCGLGDDWADTRLPLPPGAWRNEFTGETFSHEILLSDLLARFPVALLSEEAAA